MLNQANRLIGEQGVTMRLASAKFDSVPFVAHGINY
jgi:hypothetical protein